MVTMVTRVALRDLANLFQDASTLIPHDEYERPASCLCS